MKFYKYSSILSFVIILLFSIVVRAEGFVIKDIKLIGGKRTTLADLLTYTQVKKNDIVDASVSDKILKDLYASGLFLDVELYIDQDVLIVKVVEKPAISEIDIKGNNKIKDDDLHKAFDDADIVVGGVFSVSVLEQMKRELRKVYASIGRYGVIIDAKVDQLPRDRVKIELEIKEGRQAKIKHINIIGNELFSEKEILNELNSGIPSWWAILSSKDKYEKNKLKSDLEALESFYFDRGYLDFSIQSTQVTISEDKKGIFIAINVIEGEQYKISNIAFVGDLVLDKARYEEVFDEIKIGEIFSRKLINKAVERMQNELGVVGYPFATIRPAPDLDNVKNTASLIIQVDPGKKTYVNNIIFKGNEKTIDKVYRRELRQMESTLFNSQLAERSRVRIQRLPYVENVEMTKEASTERADAVDIIYDIEERLAGSFTAGVGVSDVGTSYNLGVSQSNVFGTGNSLSLNLSKSTTTTRYNVSYTNPYYKTDGLSRAISFNFSEIDTSGSTVVSTDYFLNTLTIGASYGMPVSEYSRVNFGYALGYDEIGLGSFLNEDGTSPVGQIQSYLDNNDSRNRLLKFSSTFVRDKRDRQIFAKRGSYNSLGLQWVTPLSDVAYYQLSYQGEKYFYTSSGSLRIKGKVNYGSGLNGQDDLPFYEKYLAGGTRTLRGFESSSIGPLEVRDEGAGTPQPLGGDLSTTASVEWIFNTPNLGNTSQISLFYDFGSVYEDIDAFDSSEFRSSYGITYNWLAPVGPLVISYAEPIDKRDTDQVERFQFTLGTTF